MTMASAWIVTWENNRSIINNKPLSKFAAPEELAAIFHPKKSSNYIEQQIESIFISSEYGFAAKIAYARHKNDNPLHTQFYKFNNLPYSDRMSYGHSSRFLYARKVKNLKFAHLEDTEKLTWEEIEFKLPSPLEYSI